MKCPNCGFDSSPVEKYCGMCGLRLGSECPDCGTVNPPAYNFCGHCGKRLVETIQLPVETPQPAVVAVETEEDDAERAVLAGERRVVTVLVADVTGSTELLERLGNEAWVELMNRMLLTLEAEIYRYGGLVNQFRGDGLVAFFGSDISNEDDAERAVLAGLAMQQAIHNFNATVSSNNGGIRLRVGINSGEVIVASIGDRRQHREDTAMGIAIAVAARLESAAQPGTVLASESVFQQAPSQFNWEALGEITVRGLSQPMAVFRPTAIRQEMGRAFTLEGFGSIVPLVGRENEVGKLKEYITRLQDGQGSVILLSGETGIGKGALVYETRQYFVRQEALRAEAEGRECCAEESVRWLFGRCRSYNRNSPYSIWIELLKDWLEAFAEQRGDEIDRRLLQFSRDLWGEEHVQYYPYLAELLNIELEPQYREKVEYLNADALRSQIHEALLSWLETMAKGKPLAIVISEMEWADPSSCKLIRVATALAESLPVTFLLLYRDDPQSEVNEVVQSIRESLGDLAVDIHLAPLTEDQCAKLIEVLVGVDTFPRATSDLLIHNSEGNPSYIVEIIRSLIDREVLVRQPDNHGWRLARPVTSADLQGNLARLLQTRIDRLSAEERQVLQMAAVIGVVFWSNVLQEVIEDQLVVREPLGSLVKAQLIDRRGRNTELGWEFSFRTELIHSVVYESLLTSQRESYHLQIAQTLEEINTESSGIQHQAMIAFHYRRAGEPRKELFYAVWAAEKAREVYGADEANAHYTRALELLDQLTENADPATCRVCNTQRFEVLIGRQAVRFQLGDVEGGTADARELLALAKALDNEPSWTVDALLTQPEITHIETRENIDAGLEMASQALEISRRINDRHRELFSLIARSRLLNAKGELPEFFSLANEALALARGLGDVETQVELLVRIANTYGMEDLTHNQEYLNAALPLAEQVQNKYVQLDLLSALSEQCEREGNYYKLLTEFLAKRLAITQEIGDRWLEKWTLTYYVQAEGLYLGNMDAALTNAEKALKIGSYGASSNLYPMLRMAQLQTYLGLFSEAEATLAKAAPLSESGAYDIGIAGRLLVSAILRNTRGQPEDLKQALAEATQVKKMAEAQRISSQYRMAACCQTATAYLSLFRQEKDQKKREKYARKALEESTCAVELYESYGFVQVIECFSEEVLFAHASALDINGKKEEAAYFLQRAYDEVMRKAEMIPAESEYRSTFLENVRVHRDILNAYKMGKR